MARGFLSLFGLALGLLVIQSEGSPSHIHGREASASAIDLAKGIFKNAQVVSGPHGNKAFQMSPDTISGEASLTVPSQSIPLIRPGTPVVVKATYQALPSTLTKRAEELANCTLSIFLGGNLIFTNTILTTDGNYTTVQILTTFPSGPKALILNEVCPPGVPVNVTIGGVTVGPPLSTPSLSVQSPPTGPLHTGTISATLPPFNVSSAPSVGHPTPVISAISNHSSITSIIKTLPPFTNLSQPTVSPIVTPIVYPFTSSTSRNYTVPTLTPHSFRNSSSATATSHPTSVTSRGVPTITAPPYVPGACKWRPHNYHNPVPCGAFGYPDATKTGFLLAVATNLPGPDHFKEQVEECAALCTALTGCTSYFLARTPSSNSWTCKFYSNLDLNRFFHDNERTLKFAGNTFWFSKDCLVCRSTPPVNTINTVTIPTPSSSSSLSSVVSNSLPLPTCTRVYNPPDSLACGIRGFDQPGHLVARARTRDTAGCAAYCQHLNDVRAGTCGSFSWQADLVTCNIWGTNVWNALGNIATGGAQYQRNTMDDFGCWFCPVNIQWFGVWDQDQVLRRRTLE